MNDVITLTESKPTVFDTMTLVAANVAGVLASIPAQAGREVPVLTDPLEFRPMTAEEQESHVRRAEYEKAAAILTAQTFSKQYDPLAPVIAAAESGRETMSQSIVGLARYAQTMFGEVPNSNTRLDKRLKKYKELVGLVADELLSMAKIPDTIAGNKSSRTDRLNSFAKGRYFLTLASDVRQALVWDGINLQTKEHGVYVTRTVGDIKRLVAIARAESRKAAEKDAADKHVESGDGKDGKLPEAEKVPEAPLVIQAAWHKLNLELQGVDWEEANMSLVIREILNLAARAIHEAANGTDFWVSEAYELRRHFDSVVALNAKLPEEARPEVAFDNMEAAYAFVAAERASKPHATIPEDSADDLADLEEAQHEAQAGEATAGELPQVETDGEEPTGDAVNQ